jgi:adenylate cyclase
MPEQHHTGEENLLSQLGSAIASRAELKAIDPLRPWRMIGSGNIFIIFISIIVFACYAVFRHGIDRIALITSLIAGIPVGFVIALIETRASEFRRRHRRTHFLLYLFFRTLRISFWFMLMFIFSMQMVHWLNIETGRTIFPKNLTDFFTTEKVFEFFAISLAISLVSNFIDELQRKLGRDAVYQLVFGKYHQVRKEERLFLFIDLNNSTTIAEEMGEMEFSHFLQDYFYDISEPIARYKGNVYQYVGDEVVVTWPLKKGLRQALCIRCFFAVQRQIQRYEKQYMKRYGRIPEFKAGLHGGDAVISEVGKYKSEIAFHGDVLNTTARIMSKCNELGAELLTSQWVLEQLELPAYLQAKLEGSFNLRGRQQEIEVSSVVTTSRYRVQKK